MMTPGPNLKIVVRLPELELLKKYLGHSKAIMLSGMHHNRMEFGIAPHFRHNRGDLHDIRPGAYDVKNFKRCKGRIKLIIKIYIGNTRFETAYGTALPPCAIMSETGIEQGVKGVVGGVEGGVVGGVTGGIVGGLAEAPPPPPPPPPPAPVRVGGNIKQPTKVKDVKPVYPAIAQSARVQGVVIIEATIGPNGAVQEAKVLRSIPLLDAAALEAVRQWQFTPTLLNGVPVPVIMTVTVNFTLQ